MGRRAVLVIAGNFAQALEAVLAHRITSASSTVEDPAGLKFEGETACLTKVTTDGEKFNGQIAAWLDEARGNAVPLGPGTLLRARWS